MELIIFIAILCLGYFAGSMAEAKHYKSIKARECKFLYLPALTFNKGTLEDSEIKSAQLVHGSAVISIDYFKRFLASLRNIFGGEVSSYESLIDRARREAMLRMKEMAAAGDASVITNLRIETSTIGKRANQGNVGSVEALAYGTAIVIRK